MATEPTVYLVDDDSAVLGGLSLLLDTHGFRVVTFSNAQALLTSCRTDWRGCLITDLNMPGMGGLDLQHCLRERSIHLPIIFLTAYGDIPTTVKAMKSGAMDFLTKPIDSARLLNALRAALDLDARLAQERQIEHNRRNRLGSLSEREREVLDLALKGLSNKDIARRLSISHRTVEVHRSHILSKTGAGNLLELAAYGSHPPDAEPS